MESPDTCLLGRLEKGLFLLGTGNLVFLGIEKIDIFLLGTRN